MATVGGISKVKGNENNLEVDSLARFALEEHNKRSFVDLSECDPGVREGVYITLEAADGDIKKAYEANVWVKLWQNFKEVQEFKPLGNASKEGNA